VAQQLYVVWRVSLRVTRYGSQIALYRGLAGMQGAADDDFGTLRERSEPGPDGPTKAQAVGMEPHGIKETMTADEGEGS
jgi:hypothetical protein